MLDLFRKNISDEKFWETLCYPYVGIGVLRYYSEKFLVRLDSLIAEKNITKDCEYDFAKSLAVKKFRDACIRYYDIVSYTNRDVEDSGNHLMVVAECYEWVAVQLGIPVEKLTPIRLDTDEWCVNRLFEEG